MAVFQSVWFFLPALVANMCPGFANQLHLPGGTTPVSRKWLGKNKTLAAYYSGPIGSLMVIYLQRLTHSPWALFDYDRADLWLLGLLFGFGAVVGDHM